MRGEAFSPLFAIQHEIYLFSDTEILTLDSGFGRHFDFNIYHSANAARRSCASCLRSICKTRTG